MEPNFDDMFSFKERVALITGAGGTLGGESAVMFAKYGARLVLIDNHAGRLEEMLEKLRQNGHPQEKVFSMIGDVTSEEDVNKLVEDTIHNFGQINFVVNVVGVKRMGSLEATKVEALEENFTDIRATFLVTKACQPHLEATKGSVVNISSVSGLIAFPNGLPYGTAKAGLNHMTKMLAADFAKKGVRVNSICASSVFSDFQLRNGTFKTQEELDEYFRVAGQYVPMGRVGLPSEIASAILFLCTDAAAFITGATLPVDGGFTLAIR